MEQHEPKISLPEIIIITPYFLLTDIIGIALASFGLDDYFLLDIIRFPASQLYLRLKGLKSTANTVTSILEALPYVGALPFATIGWLITIYLDQRPEIESKVNKVAKPMASTAK